METKVCSKCKEDKKVCEFGNSKTSKDGLLYCCKKCNALNVKLYFFYRNFYFYLLSIV